MQFSFHRHQRLWEQIHTTIDSIDLAHDRQHIFRVYRWALRLAPEANADPDLCGAAALLHDIINIPKESIDRPLGSELSAIEGAKHLPIAGYTEPETATIVDGIRTCSWSKGLEPTNPIGVVLQDADRLDAIGAVGIMRNIACAQAMSSRGKSGTFYHPSDPLGQTTRKLNDKTYAIDHFSIKLLRLCDGMRLATAKIEAQKRHAAMLSFLTDLQREVMTTDPTLLH